MQLLDALMKAVEGTDIHVQDMNGEIARTVIFVFTDEDESAFVSELETEELVPLLERWCTMKRKEMGSIQ